MARLTSIKKWRGNYGSAESVSTLAQKAYEMNRILEACLLGEFSFSGEMIAIVVLAVLLLVVLVGVATAAYVREWGRQRAQKENKDRETVGAIKSVHEGMQAVCEMIKTRVDVDREHHQQMLNELEKIGELVATAEGRLTEQVKETRQLLTNPRRDGHGRTGTRIDINGNVNQAGGQIKND